MTHPQVRIIDFRKSKRTMDDKAVTAESDPNYKVKVGLWRNPSQRIYYHLQ